MIHLQRVTRSEHGTFGVLSKDGIPLCYTLEDPWNDNKRNVSCIPAGNYPCEKFSGKKYKNVWILDEVPGRSYILIHAGNTIDDTQGCILTGTRPGWINGKPGVLQSRTALQVLQENLPDDFILRITDPC